MHRGGALAGGISLRDDQTAEILSRGECGDSAQVTKQCDTEAQVPGP